MLQKSFTIGILAEKAGVSVETIRYYQRRKLLPEPVKPLKGIRYYSESELQRVLFIKQGQKLGFSLNEIAELLSLEDGEHCQQVKEIAQKKLAVIRERIESLRAAEAALSDLVKNCGNNRDSATCPIILAMLRKPE